MAIQHTANTGSDRLPPKTAAGKRQQHAKAMNISRIIHPVERESAARTTNITQSGILSRTRLTQNSHLLAEAGHQTSQRCRAYVAKLST